MSDLPEPDRLEGAPHPRETLQLFGHQSAEATFLAAFNAARLHHAWLISGPKGVGKATLAWRLARFLLATPEDDGGFFAAPKPATLDIPAGDPVAHRIAALSEPRLFLLRRPYDDKAERLRAEITVDETRSLRNFLGLSAADGGRRVVIVDSADEMNRSAANGILKLLEEPPAKVTFLMISHQPADLLPTIRSRCRDLRLAALTPPDLAAALTQAGAEIDAEDREALAELAGGSVGEAFRLSSLDGLKLYAALIRLFSTLPKMDRALARQLAEAGASRKTPEAFDLTVTLIDTFLARLARAAALRALPPEAARGEAQLIERLASFDGAARVWADLAQHLGLRARKGKAVNLDPAALLMDMVLKVDETAALVVQR
ncbi:DNA polymerase III subunit delta' [bacterium]|nr:DNA polymerase III subunit delta' [bacterium]